jgi:hypothetical protein
VGVASGSRRSYARDVCVGMASAAVVAFLVAYALSSPRVEVQAAVAAVQQHPGRAAVVHGRVLEAAGDGVGNAEIRVERGGTRARLARTSERGYFRIDLAGSCASYRILVRVSAEERPVEAAVGRRLCPGDAAEVEARVIASGQLVWVPIR